jgi:hypothetical protein
VVDRDITLLRDREESFFPNIHIVMQSLGAESLRKRSDFLHQGDAKPQKKSGQNIFDRKWKKEPGA